MLSEVIKVESLSDGIQWPYKKKKGEHFLLFFLPCEDPGGRGLSASQEETLTRGPNELAP